MWPWGERDEGVGDVLGVPEGGKMEGEGGPGWIIVGSSAKMAVE